MGPAIKRNPGIFYREQQMHDNPAAAANDLCQYPAFSSILLLRAIRSESSITMSGFTFRAMGSM